MGEGLDLSWSHVVSTIATAAEVLAIAFVPMVLLRKKEPAATFAWIFVLLFVPVAGVVLFWYLGRDRIRRPMRRRVAETAPMRERIEDRIAGAFPAQEEERERVIGSQPEEQQGVMRLAARMGRGEIRAGNDVRVLVGAPATYDAMIEAIAAARDHVHLEYYIFRPDRTGRRVLDALVEAAKRGVRVRLLYDGYGSVGLGPACRALRRAGGIAKPFFPLDPIRRAATINLRNHRKLMIVDGVVGFCGGLNVGDMFLDWRDLHLRVDGPAVTDLQKIFVEDWFFAARQDLTLPAFFPEIPKRGEAIVQIVESGPDERVEQIHRLLFAAIASARRTVWIATPYFVPDRAVLVALQTAALRGVDVKVIVPRESNHRVTFHAGRSFYDELLAAGVQIHEYLPGMLHTKAMIVDGRIATVGSANLDVRSFRLNFELIAVLYDADIVRALQVIFEEDLARTERVSLVTWRGRPVITRIKEGMGRLFSPLL
ncbi:cardiolipin synthase [Sandaracinus amylolyticus]|uniref:Cardiolipin synthase n=1 Tax=Sandaracinus amylolyticus TaxID=927083 RepID=A0A0F6YI70_9BACT|nr:cardiolipin synthase [Sandaracinus amylolyticus]AKF06397.1 Cardiolipin synthetase [Sandaracinus amylolyticus]